jgi:hypothetical protein
VEVRTPLFVQLAFSATDEKFQSDRRRSLVGSVDGGGAGGLMDGREVISVYFKSMGY